MTELLFILGCVGAAPERPPGDVSAQRGVGFGLTRHSTLTGPRFSWYGQSMAAGDVNGDGTSDLAVSAAEGEYGQADLYSGGSPLAITAGFTSGPGTDSLYGARVATCDLDGDGFDDLAVSSEVTDEVWVYRGSAAGPVDLVVLQAPDGAWDGGSASGPASSTEIGPGFGGAVTCGDIDGDGLDDLLVGGRDADHDRGRVWLYPGVQGPLSTVPAWEATGPEGRRYWADTVAWLGDVDGDGFGDFAVGTLGEDGDAATVFQGGPDGPGGVIWEVDLNAGARPAAERVAEAGDVNGDGFADLLVADGIAGQVHLFLGSSDGLAVVPGWTVQTTQIQSAFGASITGLDDLDGDGYREIAVGAPYWNETFAAEGAVFVYRGTASGAETTATFVLLGGAAATTLTTAVSAGDLDLDGFPDLAFAAASRNEIWLYSAAPTDGTTPPDSGVPTEDSGAPADTAADTATDTDSGTCSDCGPDYGPDKAPDGCGCATPTGGGRAGWVVGLTLLAIRRRSRR